MLTNYDAVIRVGIAMVAAFIIALATTPVAMKLAFKLGAIDNPGVKGTDSERHLHTRPTPRMGGLAIYLGTFFSVILFVPMGQKVASMLIGASIIALLGMVDDVRNLKAMHKLIVQFFCAGIAVLGGNKITFFSSLTTLKDGSHINLGLLAIPVTLLWIVLITNAVNLTVWTVWQQACLLSPL